MVQRIAYSLPNSLYHVLCFPPGYARALTDIVRIALEKCTNLSQQDIIQRYSITLNSGKNHEHEPWFGFASHDSARIP